MIAVMCAMSDPGRPLDDTPGQPPYAVPGPLPDGVPDSGLADVVLARLTTLYPAAGNPFRAQEMVAYMKGAAPFLGIRSPERRALSRAVLDGVPRPGEAARRAVVAKRLGEATDWPGAGRLRLTAVDAESGALGVFDGGPDGVGLVDAVTASCAIPGAWPPASLAGRRWIDGGIHSTANAHLASGRKRVIVVAPSAMGSKAVHSPARQAADLTAAGSRVVVITPDADSKAVIGARALDPAQRGAAARAGRAQAAAHAKAVAALGAR
ncbi:patatin-like phospholipase family protein [Streptomyces roseolus]|uniref:patatin-like phospholipase family protein n=1 Tax=Streptomyces roseolus TaxID=67358 RepID=UPI0019C2C06F|nr:patatin-like phospholipase family protein [Streptomyces roseolus]GGR34000.1 hypothetical protein GCM10010282_27970 [Streptomyces roseolus]